MLGQSWLRLKHPIPVCSIIELIKGCTAERTKPICFKTCTSRILDLLFLSNLGQKKSRAPGPVYTGPGKFFHGQAKTCTKLVIPYVNTTTYGLHSFRYTSANMWNKLTEDPLLEFRTKICQISFEHQCDCYLCK